MHILVLNVGSSSLKVQLIVTGEPAIAASLDRRLARVHVEQIGGDAIVVMQVGDSPAVQSTARLRDHTEAMRHVIDSLVGGASRLPLATGSSIDAVGHRVVHGGGRFVRATRIDDEVLRALQELAELAPLHNAHNLQGILAARAVLGADVPQVAVFDTAFHHTLPEAAYIYAIPYRFYQQHHVRRYGFHGTSHRYLAGRYRQLMGTSPEDTKIITLHLGNGASACAIAGGNSIDTSMGFTPLEGLVMGTRCGDLDPAILTHLAASEGVGLAELDSILNEQSGLLGISGLSADMRVLQAEISSNDHRRARLAVDLFCYRVKKYLGAYLAAMNGADAIVFAGGIGEHSAGVRAQVCAGLEWLGIRCDLEANEKLSGKEGRFDASASRVALWVIPTDEELLIARDTWHVVTGTPLPD